MKLWESDDELFENSCCNLNSTHDAKRVCDSLGITHYTFNFKDEFKHYVMDDFVSKYEEAKTPNPCVECNRYLKFEIMYKKAIELGASYIATGHYAKIEYDEKYGKHVMKKSNADKKDQTYALYNIPSQIVEHVIFPLGNFHDKSEIRDIAEENNLNVAKKPDSQEICFIPDDNYVGFLLKHNVKNKLGNMVDTNGKFIRKHQGIINYTIGQRRGLGISTLSPKYVVKIEKDTGNIVIGDEKDIYTKEIVLEDINYILFDKLNEPLAVTAKVRYSAKEAKAILYPNGSNDATIVFEEAQRAVTPGQSVVFYLDDYVVGGGKIR